jgi:Uma2 family endonuclease
MSITAEQLDRIMPSAAGLLSDEPEMESSLHYLQLLILYASLDYHWRERDDYFIGANLTVYYNREQLKSRDFRGPDLFLVTGVEKRARNSWVVWEEGGRYPDLIIELLSDSTEDVDREIKRRLYAERFRTPEYFWFSPVTEEFSGFQLIGGSYQELPGDERGWRWSRILNLYLGVHHQQLRYFTPSSELVPTPEEAALQMQEELAQKEEAARKLQQQLKRETRRAAKLAAKLKELGINPDEI